LIDSTSNHRQGQNSSSISLWFVINHLPPPSIFYLSFPHTHAPSQNEEIRSDSSVRIHLTKGEMHAHTNPYQRAGGGGFKAELRRTGPSPQGMHAFPRVQPTSELLSQHVSYRKTTPLGRGRLSLRIFKSLSHTYGYDLANQPISRLPSHHMLRSSSHARGNAPLVVDFFIKPCL